MSLIKTGKDIEIMKQGGKILAQVMQVLVTRIKAGMTGTELDSLAEKEIIKRGGKPNFKMVKGYHHATCISVNEVVVHGIPRDIPFKEGDIVGIDCGVFYQGFNTDMGQTVQVGNSFVEVAKPKMKNSGLEREIGKFLDAGKNALWAGIDAARPGNRVGHISLAMQKAIEAGGYSVVKSLVGHGIGRKLHEAPEIPGFLSGNIVDTPLLKTGMTVAVEIIYNMGKEAVVYQGGDDWTIATEDGSLSGFFERSILITGGSPDLLTKLWID